MKIDFTQTLKMISGEVMKDMNEKNEAVDATIKMAVVNALLAPQKEEDTGINKIKKYELAKMIYNSEGETDITVEDVALIKKAVEKAFPSPMIVGQVNEMLEK